MTQWRVHDVHHSSSTASTRKPVHLDTFAGLQALHGWVRPARTHQQRLTLMSSPTTLDAPPTPFRAVSQAPRSMLVNWLSFLTPSCCHCLNFTNSASTRFWCPLIISRTCCSPRILSKILRSPRACRSAARSPYRAFLPTAQHALGVGLLLHEGGRSPPPLPAAAPRRWPPLTAGCREMTTTFSSSCFVTAVPFSSRVTH